jgi:hypothetical protein
MRQHYKPAPIPRLWADALLAVSIGLILAAILLEYLA